MEHSLNIIYKLEYNTLKLELWGLSPFHNKQPKGNAYLTAAKYIEIMQEGSDIIGLRTHNPSLRQCNFLSASQIFNKMRILELY